MAQHLAVTAITAALVLSFSLPAKATIQPPANQTQDPAAPTAAEQELFTRGQKLYLQGNYTQAAEALVNLLKNYPNSIITDLTLLWLGRSYYQLGKFTEAQQVSKRLRAIKDTPFADIYDSELASARREAASRQMSAATGETPALPQRRQADSVAVRLASRNRFAGGSGTSRSLPKRKVTNNAAKPPPRKPTTASQSNAGIKSNRPVTRQRVSAVPVNSKRPTTANDATARARVLSSSRRNESASNNEVRHAGTNQLSRQPALTATQHRILQNRQTIAAKSKPLSASRVSGTGSSAHISVPGRAASVRKQAPRQSNAAPNQAVAKSMSDRRSRRTASDGTTVSEQESSRQPPGRKRSITGSSDSAPSLINRPIATGGLYSMIDASATNLPVRTSPQTLISVISKRVNAKPGEIVYLSFIVRNSGSARQTYEFRISAPGAPEAKIYVDSNGDGIHQSDELPVTGSPLVELANSELSLLLEITVPRDAFEGQQYSYTLTVLSSDKEEVVARATSTLTVSSIRARLLPRHVAGDIALLAALSKSP